MRNDLNYLVVNCPTINIGDDIQTLAAIKFLSMKGIKEYSFIDRENLSSYKGPKAYAIMNGWYLYNIDNFPPPKNVIPIFIGFHVNHPKLVPKNIEYFKNHEPIGCRDYNTLMLFKKHKIKAVLTGCLTMLFDEKKFKDDNIYLVDCEEKDIDYNIINYRKINHLCMNPQWEIDYRLRIAQDFLLQYSSAKLIITTRLHCALPCRAFGTNCIFFHKKYYTDPRFSGLEEILNGKEIFHKSMFTNIDFLNRFRENILNFNK